MSLPDDQRAFILQVLATPTGDLLKGMIIAELTGLPVDLTRLPAPPGVVSATFARGTLARTIPPENPVAADFETRERLSSVPERRDPAKVAPPPEPQPESAPPRSAPRPVPAKRMPAMRFEDVDPIDVQSNRPGPVKSLLRNEGPEPVLAPADGEEAKASWLTVDEACTALGLFPYQLRNRAKQNEWRWRRMPGEKRRIQYLREDVVRGVAS